jgi:hypothetical protein
MFKAFFYNIAGEFMITEFNDSTFDAFYNFVLIFNWYTLFKYVLNHIVTKLIFGKDINICKNGIKYRSSLSFMAIFKDSLNHSTSISVNAKLAYCFWMDHCLHNEVNCIIRHLLNTFLNNMISILIKYTIKDRVFKFLY